MSIGVLSRNCITYIVRAAAIMETLITAMRISESMTVPMTVRVLRTGPAFFFFLFFFLLSDTAPLSAEAIWAGTFFLLSVLKSIASFKVSV